MTEQFEAESIKKKISSKFCEINKNKLNICIKSVIFISCLLGLLLQTSQLVSQYLTGQTVVNIKVGKEKYDRIPSITICYPTMVSMEKFIKIYPESKEKFDQYMKLINMSGLERMNLRFDFENKTMNDYLKDLYIKYFVKNPKVFDLPVYEIFEKLSIPLKYASKGKYVIKNNKTIFDKNGVEMKNAITAEASGRVSGEMDFEEEVFIEDNMPIETITRTRDGFGKKCFTFFSDLTEKWRDFKMELDLIKIKLIHDRNWFPSSLYNKRNSLRLSIHSSNILPELSFDDNYIRLTPGKVYDLVFNRLKTILLPPNYKTNCRYYDLNDGNHEQMRTDCLSKCVNKNLQKTCTNCVFQTGYLLRELVFSKYKTEKFCNITYDWGLLYSYNIIDQCLHKHLRKAKSNCEKSCQKECEKTYYDFNIKEESTPSESWDIRTSIYIKSNRLPDQVIEHLPEVELITFICNFGGLLGMWLGLSALSILDFVSKKTKIV